MNHPGEIAGLARLVRPHVAVITTVAPVHLGFFASVEAIADAKAEIFFGLEPGGVAVLNRDNGIIPPCRAALRAGAVEVIGFGTDPEATVRLVDFGSIPTAARSRRVLGPRALPFAGPRPALGSNALAVLAATWRPARISAAAAALGSRSDAGPRTPSPAGLAGRDLDRDRRELQCEPGGDGGRAGGAGAASPPPAGGAWRCSATCSNSAPRPRASIANWRSLSPRPGSIACSWSARLWRHSTRCCPSRAGAAVALPRRVIPDAIRFFDRATSYGQGFTPLG